MNEAIDFEDAQELHRQRPTRNRVPDPEELDALKPGDYVLLAALGERFWAEVTALHEGRISATIDTKLNTRKLYYGQEISFGKEHIFGIVTKELYAKAAATRRQQSIVSQRKRK